MAKKNPYVFTIGFDETDPVHIRAAEILNGTKKKAQLIAAAILSYVDGVDSKENINFNLETIYPLLEKLVQKEFEKIIKNSAFPKSKQHALRETPENVLNLSDQEGEMSMNENLMQNIIMTMDIFRRN